MGIPETTVLLFDIPALKTNRRETPQVLLACSRYLPGTRLLQASGKACAGILYSHACNGAAEKHFPRNDEAEILEN